MSSDGSHGAACGCALSRRAILGGAAAAASLGAASAALAQASPSAARAGARRGPRVDAHVHLSPPAWFRANIFEQARRTRRRRSTPKPLRSGLPPRDYEDVARGPEPRAYPPTLEGQTRRLLDEMDAAGIDTAVLFAMDFDYTGEKLHVQHWEQLVQLAQVRDAHPGRFVLFAAIDPRRGKAGLELLRRAATELKVSGMGEFAPHFFGFAPNDRERCYPIYELCSELDLPIAPNCSIISSHNSEFCNPIYFESVANDFPQLNISLTSAGFPHWTEDAIALAQAKPNVYLDIGDWQLPVVSDPVDHVLRYVRRALDTEARRKILFGSDFPVFNRRVSMKRWADMFTVDAKARGIRFTDEELHLFFSDNVQEFLDMDLPMPVGASR